ncbi:3-deoxy-D-manno-octulosonic acid transferase [Belnapia sp. F-4-1]|uniref:3-deoxy-D-manno-octulosonic acid transferase n=1 Tax=Belnapia sp. F-4-1 TaxID=1545443 RepID=UPI00068BE93F|nr:3-deoxy-D-manno-octulosonic acid transferase [Belnapia sp. F-4-1]
MSLAGLAWRCGATLASPLLPLWLRLRRRRGKEIAGRLPERRGLAAVRPPGPLLWLHAASIGETLSLLPVLDALAARAPGLTMLLTTGTVTSAALLERRLPDALRPQVIHRFVPLDVPAWVARFLDAWRPDAAGLVESELWPNLIRAARIRRLPLVLINGRLSARSAARWRLAPALGRELMAAFTLILAQSGADAARFAALGARDVHAPGNLKEAAPPLPADPTALAALRDAIGPRPVLLGAATHPGEEAMLIATHGQLAAEFPGLLTILVPRHPERGAAIAAEAGSLPTIRRSAGALPGPGTALYIADTLGELGLFYRLAHVALVGGSLVPHGGQNPLEPARLGCPILLGPHTGNFTDIAARLLAAGGARLVTPPEPGALAAAIRAVLSNPDHGRNLAKAAAAAIAPAATLPDQVAEALLHLLPAAGDEDRSTPDAQ